MGVFGATPSGKRLRARPQLNCLLISEKLDQQKSFRINSGLASLLNLSPPRIIYSIRRIPLRLQVFESRAQLALSQATCWYARGKGIAREKRIESAVWRRQIHCPPRNGLENLVFQCLDTGVINGQATPSGHIVLQLLDQFRG